MKILEEYCVPKGNLLSTSSVKLRRLSVTEDTALTTVGFSLQSTSSTVRSSIARYGAYQRTKVLTLAEVSIPLDQFTLGGASISREIFGGGWPDRTIPTSFLHEKLQCCFTSEH